MFKDQASGFGLQASGRKAPRIAWWLATGFGSGYLKPAPGTWGSLAGLLAWLLMVFGMRATHWKGTPYLLLSAPLALSLLAVWASDRVVKETGQKDPSFIVADEWAGIWVALTPLLFTATLQPQPWSLWMARLVAPFMLFRLFDIWKPGAVDTAQRLPGGWGVVMDDVLAGLLAALLVWPLDRWLGAQSLLNPALWGR
ncbi:MAG: phosphatidylglycerophosphatase A [Geothrix sp.]|uniref:phosphatidylglycerophosphatase A family protein n=1 Tax=Geothrix sp. TaxID=1962974 RepID=UPI001799CC0C|nr:phosphatidylglycerophosphatase A [Geothrix sp.]NWJ40703.1 phosphatidylglycerophosphatase A [Geothrix sp.]WIL21290.1 MAG: phosphatidylglycerophosphatase A [Geothrix sp.]